MAVTTLDPKTALIVIDLQNGIVALPTVHPAGEVVKYASALADAFRRHGLPVVLVSVAGAPSGRTERARSVAQLPGAKPSQPPPYLSAHLPPIFDLSLLARSLETSVGRHRSN